MRRGAGRNVAPRPQAARDGTQRLHPPNDGGKPNELWGMMAEPRLKAGLWVKMALRLADQAGRPGVVLRRGDADAGGVLVTLRGREGLVVLSQVRTTDGALAWMRATGPAPVDQAAVDAYVARAAKFDPDVWVLEFEAPDLLPPFEAKLL